MRYFFVLFLIVNFLILANCSEAQEASGLQVYLHPDLGQYGLFSHVCKMRDDTRYYAVLGTRTGTVFVNYTDAVIEEGDIQFFPGAPSLWRECRSYNHQNAQAYAYVVTEGPDFKEHPGGIQIFKLGKGGVEMANTYVGNFNSAHTNPRKMRANIVPMMIV